MKRIIAVFFLVFLLFVPVVHAEETVKSEDIIKFKQDVFVSDSSGNIFCILGNVTVNGEFKGNILTVFGNVFVKGQVSKDVTAIGGKVNILPSGNVSGETTSIDSPLYFYRLNIENLIFRLIFALLIVAAYYIINKYTGNLRLKLYYRLKKKPLKVLFSGYLVMLLVVASMVLLSLTVVGLLILPALITIAALMYIVGITVFSEFLGKLLLNKLKIETSSITNVLIGSVLLEGVLCIPYVNLAILIMFIIPISVGIYIVYNIDICV